MTSGDTYFLIRLIEKYVSSHCSWRVNVVEYALRYGGQENFFSVVTRDSAGGICNSRLF